MSVCKEILLIRPPAREKSNYLSVTSPDGITWTIRGTRGTKNINCVTWTGDQFVAVGDSGLILTSPLENGIIVSPEKQQILSSNISMRLSGRKIFVQFENKFHEAQGMFSIFSLRGERLYEGNIASNASNVVVETGSFAPGMYLFTLSYQGKHMEKTFVISR